MFARALTFAALLCAASVSAQDAGSVVSRTSAAMGADNLTGVALSGTAADVNFLQSRNIAGPWPFRAINNYTQAIDLNQMSARGSGDTNNQGLFGGAPVAGRFNRAVTPQSAGWSQQLDYWLTPWGFLKGAAANNATTHVERIDGRNLTVVTWSPPSLRSPSGLPYRVNGYINAQNLIERVETWVEHDMLGDMHVESHYSGYRDFGRLKVPTNMVQERGGWPYFKVLVTDVRANPGDLAALVAAPQGGARGGGPPGGGGGPPGGGGGPPGGGAAAAAPPPSTRLADGVHLINGAYNALAVEFADHIVVVEAGQNLARGEAILAEVRRLFPTKPIGYVVNSHPHSDHSSGLAPLAAAGATIVTHDNNVGYFEEIFNAPRTLLGDSLARSNKRVKVEGTGAMRVFTDGNQRLEIHHIQDTDIESVHSDGIVVVLVPRARLLFQADFTLPQAGQEGNPFTKSLARHVDRLGLDFDAYVSVHNSTTPQTRADLLRTIGK
jgi:glyoxylase-like metal-dependent hydrolase (beta-lactamase superfamily II)